MRTKWPKRLAWQSVITKHLELKLCTKHLARKGYHQKEPGKTEYWVDMGVRVSVYWGWRNGLWAIQLIQEIDYISQNSSFSFFIRWLSVFYSLWIPEFIKISKWWLWILPGTGSRYQKLLLSRHRHSSTPTSYLIGKSWKTATVKPRDF